MALRRKYGRPTRPDLLTTMAINAVVAFFLLHFLFALFGVNTILPERLAGWGIQRSGDVWQLLGLMVPGAGIGFGCLWYWLVLTGRSSRGIAWGSALLYGVAIACGNLPVTGFFLGMLEEAPLLFALILFILLFLVPQLLVSMLAFGLLMGGFNAWMAERWVTRHRL